MKLCCPFFFRFADYVCNKANMKSVVIVFNEDFELMEFEDMLKKKCVRKIYTATKQDYMLSG